MKEKLYKQLDKGLVVSCQALENEPLHSSFIMSRMARAAAESGAVGIRANSIVDIQAIRDTVKLPVIGIIKKEYPNVSVFITPTLKEVRQVCATGCEIVALDGTTRPRPNDEKLIDIIQTIRKEYPDVLLMADTGNIEDVKYSIDAGFDIIGTTLHGYTEVTNGMNIADEDFSYLKEVLKISTLPVIAEGKVDTPYKAKRAIELGCLCVVSGGAITRPQEITQRFVEEIEKLS